jgi:hypothetical protein
LRGVDEGSHLLTTDNQNRVLAGRGVGDGGVIENESPTYTSQHENNNGERTNMLLLLLLLCIVSDTRTRTDQRIPTYGGGSGGDGGGGDGGDGGRKKKLRTKKKYRRKTEMKHSPIWFWCLDTARFQAKGHLNVRREE